MAIYNVCRVTRAMRIPSVTSIPPRLGASTPTDTAVGKQFAPYQDTGKKNSENLYEHQRPPNAASEMRSTKIGAKTFEIFRDLFIFLQITGNSTRMRRIREMRKNSKNAIFSFGMIQCTSRIAERWSIE